MHIDRIEFICYFSFAEKTNASLFDIAYFFCHGDDTAIAHAHTVVYICIHFAHYIKDVYSWHRVYAANTGERSLCCILHSFTCTKIAFETRSVCAYAARTQCFCNSHIIRYPTFMPCTVQKRGAWKRRHKLFFAFFY